MSIIRIIASGFSAAAVLLSPFAVPAQASSAVAAATPCVRPPVYGAHNATAISPSGVSEVLSSDLGYITPMPALSGKPDWNRPDEVNDVLVPRDSVAVLAGNFLAYTWKGQQYPRTDFLVVNTATGEPSDVAPSFDGTIYTIELSCDGQSVYVGGAFDHVNGVVRHNAAQINLADGSVTGWNPDTNGVVYDIAIANHRLILGGAFSTVGTAPRVGIASVNQATGAVTNWMNVQLSGGVSMDPTLAFNVVGSPDGSKIIVTGNFFRVNGVLHRRIAVLQWAKKHPSVVRWATIWTKDTCSRKKSHEELGVAFTPKGNAFYTVATGGDPGGQTDCDAATKWSLGKAALASKDVQPTWSNYTDLDSLSGVVATSRSVFVAGHNKWCSADPGRPMVHVDHPGVCEIDAITGKVTDWHGTTSRARSMHVRMAITAQGIIQVGDAGKMNNSATHNDMGLWLWAN